MVTDKPDNLITPEEAARLLGENRSRRRQVGATVAAPRPAGGIDAFTTARVEEDEAAASTDRERREAAAKRRILARHSRPAPGTVWAEAEPNCCEGCGFWGEGVGERLVTANIDDCPEQRAIASVYAVHPDYEGRWATV